MGGGRYVVLGLAQVRTEWFAEVARWATSAALPMDFVKVVAIEEARARLRSGRPFSALLVDAGTPGLDRDLVELATLHGCPVVVVGERFGARRWGDIGAAAVIPATFERRQLLDTLHAVARPLERRDDRALVAPAGGRSTIQPRGRLVAVTGAGGVGRSMLAMAVATGLASDPPDRGAVLLADLALHAQQALLHDAGDIVPGLLELVDAHRTRQPGPVGVRQACHAVRDRGYDLLLGLRRQRDWTALRPRALAATLGGLRVVYRLVVADVDPDVEGEAESGSVDVEERNLLARTVLGDADLVLVVGLPGLTGVAAQIRVVSDLLDFGVAPGRIVPVVNRAPRNPRSRAELSATLARLLPARPQGRAGALASTPVFVPERRRLDDDVRDGSPPPGTITAPLTGAVRGLLTRVPSPTNGAEPVRVTPGTLGTWSHDEEDLG